MPWAASSSCLWMLLIKGCSLEQSRKSGYKALSLTTLACIVRSANKLRDCDTRFPYSDLYHAWSFWICWRVEHRIFLHAYHHLLVYPRLSDSEKGTRIKKYARGVGGTEEASARPLPSFPFVIFAFAFIIRLLILDYRQAWNKLLTT